MFFWKSFHKIQKCSTGHWDLFGIFRNSDHFLAAQTFSLPYFWFCNREIELAEPCGSLRCLAFSGGFVSFRTSQLFIYSTRKQLVTIPMPQFQNTRFPELPHRKSPLSFHAKLFTFKNSRRPEWISLRFQSRLCSLEFVSPLVVMQNCLTEHIQRYTKVLYFDKLLVEIQIENIM